MNYTRISISTEDELRIVTGLIVNSDFTKQIEPIFKREYLSLPYTKIVSEWALEYYRKYDKSPVKDIVSIFESKKSEIRDNSQIELIESFLVNLNRKYEETESYNVQYEVDKAIKFFKFQSLDILTDKIKAAKISGDVNLAENLISNFKRIEKGTGTATSVWCDIEEAIKAVRNENDRNIVLKFPGALGRLIRPLYTEDFIAFIAPPKRGKSFWLVELSILASLNHKNVLFITLEMPARQLRTRIFQRVTGMVVSKNADDSEESEVDIPFFDTNFDVNKKILFKRERRQNLSTKSVVKKMSEINSFIRTDNFRIIEAPSGSLSGGDVERILDNLEHYDNFIPDLIVWDYADITRSEAKGDHRNQINDKWEYIRRIGQDRNMMQATVSHTGRDSLARDVREGDVVEDIRKLSHLTLCIGVNQLSEDKKNGIQRLSVLDDRFEEFDSSKEAVVTQCLRMGAVYLDSRVRYK
jgi:hypothetical protein